MDTKASLIRGDAGPVEIPLGAGTSFVVTLRHPDREGDNQDAATVIATGAEGGVLAVADGAGGHRAGSAASRLALEHLGEALVGSERPENRAPVADPSASRASILDGIERANLAVRKLGVGAATTLVAAEIDGTSMRPYHVGDSEILVVGQRGKIKLQTISHSPVGYAVEAGFLTEDEALAHEDRHIVSNLIGSDDMRIEMGSAVPLAPRDTLLLGSDGLFDNLDAETIVERVRSGPLDTAADELAQLARDAMHRGKPDDMTFILYRLDAERRP